MIIDKQNSLSVDIQTVSHTHISLRFIGNQFLGKDRIFTQQHQGVSAMGMNRNVLISINRLQHTVYLLCIPAGRLRFLQADDISILFQEIRQADIHSSLIFRFISESPGIVRQDLDASLRSISLHIDRHILADWYEADQKAQQWNENIPGTEDDPEYQKAKINEKKDRKEQSCIAESGKTFRIQ